MLTTTSAEQNTSTLQQETTLVERTEQWAVTASQKTPAFTLSLKKLYLYTSVTGLALVFFGLLLAFKNNHVLLIECFKALTIIGCLNLIRAFSIS